MEDLVSIIITVYNCENYIDDAIQSILNQTYTNWELIIVDDGSTDNTLKIISESKHADRRISVIENKSNLGISKSNNIGLSIAKGKFYAKLDADDLMLEHRLEKQVEFLNEHKDVSMISCQGFFINSKGKKIGTQVMPGFTELKHTKERLDKDILIACAHTGFMTYLNKIKDVGGYNEEISCTVDIDLFTRMAEKGNNLIIMQQRLIMYRVHKQSIMTIKGKSGLIKKTTDYLIKNSYLRRSGKPEIKFDEYIEDLNSINFFIRVKTWMRIKSMYHRRMSLIHYGDQSYLKFFNSFILSFLCSPGVTLKKIKFRLLN